MGWLNPSPRPLSPSSSIPDERAPHQKRTRRPATWRPHRAPLRPRLRTLVGSARGSAPAPLAYLLTWPRSAPGAAR